MIVKSDVNGCQLLLIQFETNEPSAVCNLIPSCIQPLESTVMHPYVSESQLSTMLVTRFHLLAHDGIFVLPVLFFIFIGTLVTHCQRHKIFS